MKNTAIWWSLAGKRADARPWGIGQLSHAVLSVWATRRRAYGPSDQRARHFQTLCTLIPTARGPRKTSRRFDAERLCFFRKCPAPDKTWLWTRLGGGRFHHGPSLGHTLDRCPLSSACESAPGQRRRHHAHAVTLPPSKTVAHLVETVPQGKNRASERPNSSIQPIQCTSVGPKT